MKLLLAFLALVSVVFGFTDPSDLDILNQFRKGLENPELLDWPANGDDPCGPPSWKHVFCSDGRVQQIQVQNLGLKGPLPQNFNKLSMLTNLGFQRNQFSGPLPSFSGLSKLQWAYLDYNNFSSIPADFFSGLDSLEVLALDGNHLNGTTGWMFPRDLANSAQLLNITCVSCNLVGPLPEFLGNLSSLSVLLLSGNKLSGLIPASFNGTVLKMLWLNNQDGGGMTGPIDVLTTMESLTELWLHGNQFTGAIPDSIGKLTSLKNLNLNQNQLVGLVPDSLASMELDNLDLNNNHLMGPIPKFKATNVTYDSNSFCQTTPGLPCSPQVMALIDFLGGLNYPTRLVSQWSGNDCCQGQWFGLTCSDGKVSGINLPKLNLNGTLSPSVAKLDSLSQIRLQSNNLEGPVPETWTTLRSLTSLDLSGNNISPPLPLFPSSVKVVTAGNPLLNSNSSGRTPPSGGNGPSSGGSTSPSTGSPPTNTNGTSLQPNNQAKGSKRSNLVLMVAPVASVAVAALLVIPLSVYFCKKRRSALQAPSSLVIHPRDPSDSGNMVKVVVANNTNGSVSTVTGSGSGSITSSGVAESHVIEAGNLVISVQVLQNATKNFAPENELGRGGFGVVYKGALDDGTKLAVKRMEAGVISSKALDEFQSEIAVLSKVRHRHLVSLLGYSIEGNERMLVYEYMPQGALSNHLFHWKSLKIEPLSWTRRLNIALDVARGMEYLHSLAHQSFIHRDLKSSNILLGDDFRAKVSDFGLVKLAPDGEKSVVTRLAGTFGYLAPEYAGKQLNIFSIL